MIAAAQKTMQDAQAAVTANDQKMKDLTASVATMEAQKVAQADLMTKTQTAVPMLKAALEQASDSCTGCIAGQCGDQIQRQKVLLLWLIVRKNRS